MRIAHVSDIHIRNLKMHDEYRRAFDDLYRQIDAFKPDIVINTGDTAHTKVQISPEFVEMTSDHIKQIASRCPYHIILGNHDLSLVNPDRQDALTPIVQSIKSKNVFLHKKSGMFSISEDPNFNFWVFSLADSDNFPTPIQWEEYKEKINIGLFHGSIANCVTDSDFEMTHVEYDTTIFNGLDYVLMGDIHKQQFFNDRRIAYAGSLIQQNYGEELDKGFLLWDIESKDEFIVKHVPIKGSRKFYTVKLNEELKVTDSNIEPDSRIRIFPPRKLTLSEQKTIETDVKKRFNPHDVITLSSTNITRQSAKLTRKSDITFENIRESGVQEKLIRDYMRKKGVSDNLVEKILILNQKYQVSVDQKEDVIRNISWKINNFGWTNIFNYGEGNAVDLTSIRGLTGIFAPNGSGKSNLIDVILECLFDSTTKGIKKNIFLINDNKELGSMVADISVNNQNHIIERTIERIKYGQKKFDETKEWGKTNCEFFSIDDSGEKTSLTATSRPDTERAIRQRIGSYDDMMITSVMAQWNPLDVIACGESRRREILYKFLDLDIFEMKGLLAKDEAKKFYKQLSELDQEGLQEHVIKFQVEISAIRQQLEEIQTNESHLKSQISSISDEIISLIEKKQPIDKNVLDRETILLKIRNSEKEIEKLKLSIVEKEKKIKDISSRIEKIQNLEENIDLNSLEENATRFSELGFEIDKTISLRKEKESIIENSKKKLKLLQEVPCGDKFPNCKFLIDAFSSQNELPKLLSFREQLDKDIEEKTNQKLTLLKDVERLEKYKSFIKEKNERLVEFGRLKLEQDNTNLKINQIEREIVSLNDDVTKSLQLEDSIRKNREIDAAVSDLKSKQTSLKSRLLSITDELGAKQVKLGNVEGLYEKIKERYDKYSDIKEICDVYELFIDAMGKDGISYNILTQKLPLINEEINKILMNAADFGVLIEDDPEEQSIRVYIQYGQYKPRLIELAGGAEKMLASIALRVALLNISSLPKSNMFIIDEGFGKLDPKNLENVGKMFSILKSTFDHVLIVSHLDALKDMVDNTIEITSDNEGYAHVEVGV